MKHVVRTAYVFLCMLQIVILSYAVLKFRTENELTHAIYAVVIAVTTLGILLVALFEFRRAERLDDKARHKIEWRQLVDLVKHKL